MELQHTDDMTKAGKRGCTHPPVYEYDNLAWMYLLLIITTMYKTTQRERRLEDNDTIVAENEGLVVFNQLFDQMAETYRRTGGAKVYNEKALALKKRLAEIKALRLNK